MTGRHVKPNLCFFVNAKHTANVLFSILRIKNKLNAKPQSIESQEIPRRLQNIAKFNSVTRKKGVPTKKMKKKKLRDDSLIDGRK